VHGSGCCRQFASLSAAEQEQRGWRIPERELVDADDADDDADGM
jgi:hypothetical protein